LASAVGEGNEKAAVDGIIDTRDTVAMMATAVALWDRRNLLPAEIFLLAMQSIPTKCWGRRWKNADEGKDAHDDWSMVAMIVQEYYDGYEVEFCPMEVGRGNLVRRCCKQAEIIP